MLTTTKQSVKTSRVAHERIVNNDPRTFTESDFPVGSVAHQGDLILVRIADLPAGCNVRENRQLALGSTQGARHVLSVGQPFDADPNTVAVHIRSACPRAEVSPAYIGPVFCTVGGKADLLHPEHGNHHYRGDMTIAVVYQRSLDMEERERRVAD